MTDLANRILHERDPVLRNALAIEVIDAKDWDSIPSLLVQLERPSTKGYRGTMLYALRQLTEMNLDLAREQVGVKLCVLVDIVCKGDTFEAESEASKVLFLLGIPDESPLVDQLVFASSRPVVEDLLDRLEERDARSRET